MLSVPVAHQVVQIVVDVHQAMVAEEVRVLDVLVIATVMVAAMEKDVLPVLFNIHSLHFRD